MTSNFKRNVKFYSLIIENAFLDHRKARKANGGMYLSKMGMAEDVIYNAKMHNIWAYVQ